MPKRKTLFEFMRGMLEQNACGVEYIDKEKGLFKIPWKHASCSNFNCELDSQIFKQYAMFTNKYVEGDKAYEKWKTNLRSALNKSEDFNAHQDKHVKEGNNPYRVYSISIKNDTLIRHIGGAEIPIPVLESPADCVKSEIDSLCVDQLVDSEVKFEFDDDYTMFDSNELLLSLVETDNNETLAKQYNYNEDNWDINVNIFQTGVLMLQENYKCPILIKPDLICQIPIICDEGSDNIKKKKLYESVKHGIELFMDCDKLYCKRYCLARVFYSSGFQKLPKKIERGSSEIIFQLSDFQSDISPKIRLTFGEIETWPKEPELRVEITVWNALLMATLVDIQSLEISNSNSGPPLKKLKDVNF